MYLDPIIKIHTSFEDAQKSHAELGSLALFHNETKIGLSEIIEGKRNLVIGEPGIGKTELLRQLEAKLKEDQFFTGFVSLKNSNAIDQIDGFLKAESTLPRAIFLDGLDEVRSSLFPAVLQKIDEISANNPELSVYLSARWVFISKYQNYFSLYRFVVISPLTYSQVTKFLSDSGYSDSDIDRLLRHVMSFSHRMLVIQVPRYLNYFKEFLKEKGLTVAADVSRNDLFEYMVYKGLKNEEEKLMFEKHSITKRVLEKLALVMEIYQTNSITKDELMTFFDDLKSDLKLVALSQISLETFVSHSLLNDNGETIEFQNTEFQEYLAAKEITRFSNPEKAAFLFSVDSEIKQIHPTWFNALSFFVDMEKGTIEQLMEFSHIRGDNLQLVDESLLDFFSRINPKIISEALSNRLFVELISYHLKKGQRIPRKLASALPNFFNSQLEPTLKKFLAEAESSTDPRRYISLGNIIYVVGYILYSGKEVDPTFWREKMISYAGDGNDNGVLQRHALFALEQLDDKTVIDELPNLMNADELITRAFLTTCASLDPENSKSLDYFFEATRRSDLYGRYGILEFKERASIKRFLEEFIKDESFRNGFFDKASFFADKDHEIIEHISAVLDDELLELCKVVAIEALHIRSRHSAETSVFMIALWKLLKSKEPDTFILDIIRRVQEAPNPKRDLYFNRKLFSEIIEIRDVDNYIDGMIAAGERSSAFYTMLMIKNSSRTLASDIFEAGRQKLEEEYRSLDQTQDRPDPSNDSMNDELLKEFRLLLEPSPGKYSSNVFAFYNENQRILDELITDKDRQRIKELLDGTIFKFTDPIDHPLTITSVGTDGNSYTTSSIIYTFGEAIKIAEHLNLDVNEFRKKIINYIPFAYSEELEKIFKIIKKVKPGELTDVLKIFSERTTDLWRHQTGSFIRAMEQFNVFESAAVLKDLVREPLCERFARKEALLLATGFAPDKDFLNGIFADFQNHPVGSCEKELTIIANALLIKYFSDPSSLRWRINEIRSRAAGFIRPSGVHEVSRIEDEISHGNAFARPLMEFNGKDHEKDYLDLLDSAVEIWGQGQQFHEYGAYMWQIVCSYFDNLKEHRSYSPLQNLEQKILEMQSREGVNWLAGKVVNIRRSYLSYLGKPRNIAVSIKKYNDVRAGNDKVVSNSTDLLQHIQDALETNLRRWIEDEGAYDVILSPKENSGQRQDEKLIHKTLNSQLQYILLRRGIDSQLIREPQLLNDKRSDFLIWYGFVGPIVLEVKLTSNKEIQGSKDHMKRSDSYASMEKYMKGYGSSHGIFMVVKNDSAGDLESIREVFQSIPNVHVHWFDCYKSKSAPPVTPKPSKKASRGKTPPRAKQRKVPQDKSRRLLDDKNSKSS